MTRLNFKHSKFYTSFISVVGTIVLASASGLSAGFQPGPTPFVKESSGGDYLLAMTPKNPSEYGDAQRWAKHYEIFPISGIYSNDGANRLLRSIEEYWFEETLLAFVESGGVIYAARCDWYDKPLIFQKWDQELRRYEPQDFLDRPWVVLPSMHPLQWLYSHQVDVSRMELRVQTTHSGVVVFDLTTGAVVSSNREPLMVQKAAALERSLAAKISQAFDIFAGSRDWKEAPRYIAESVLTQCSDYRTRTEVEESVEIIQGQLGDRVRYLLQLFDIESAKLPLRGVVRLAHDDSRFDLYRLPYGQAGDFLCGSSKIVEEPVEWREKAAYASIAEIKVNPKKFEVAVALGLVKSDWMPDLSKEGGLIAIWMQDPDWRMTGLTAGRIRFPKDQAR